MIFTCILSHTIAGRHFINFPRCTFCSYVFYLTLLQGDISSISLDVLSVPMYGTVILSTIGEFIIYR